MARKAWTTTPRPLQMPKVPQFSRTQRRVAEREGVELRPLAGPEIPLPPEQDEELMARWEAWQAARHPNASLLEFICWEWLVNKKKQIEGIDFLFQHPILGGRTAFGGFVADFWFPMQQMVWNPEGFRWHRTHPDDRARDKVAKMILSSRSILVIEIAEEDLLTRPEFVLEKAWRGEEMVKARSD